MAEAKKKLDGAKVEPLWRALEMHLKKLYRLIM